MLPFINLCSLLCSCFFFFLCWMKRCLYNFPLQVIDMPEHSPGDMGGTMRLGKRKTVFKTQNSVLSKLHLCSYDLPFGQELMAKQKGQSTICYSTTTSRKHLGDSFPELIHSDPVSIYIYPGLECKERNERHLEVPVKRSVRVQHFKQTMRNLLR